MKTFAKLICATTFLSLSLPVTAVMAPQYEARAALERAEAHALQRSQAPDVVQVRITQAQTQMDLRDRCPSVESWTVQAEVLEVERGKWSVGQTLQIKYARELYRCPGPVHELLPEVRQAQITHAYLRCEESICTPAAGTSSFTSPARFEASLLERKAEVRKYQPSATPSPGLLLETAPPPQVGRLEQCANAVNWLPVTHPVCLHQRFKGTCQQQAATQAPQPLATEQCFRLKLGDEVLTQGAIIKPESARLLRLPVMVVRQGAGLHWVALEESWPPLSPLPQAAWRKKLSAVTDDKEVLLVPATQR